MIVSSLQTQQPASPHHAAVFVLGSHPFPPPPPRITKPTPQRWQFDTRVATLLGPGDVQQPRSPATEQGKARSLEESAAELRLQTSGVFLEIERSSNLLSSALAGVSKRLVGYSEAAAAASGLWMTNVQLTNAMRASLEGSVLLADSITSAIEFPSKAMRDALSSIDFGHHIPESIRANVQTFESAFLSIEKDLVIRALNAQRLIDAQSQLLRSIALPTEEFQKYARIASSLAERFEQAKLDSIAYVRELVRDDRLSEARELLQQPPFVIVPDDDETARLLRKVISPPRTKRVAWRDIDRQKDFAWLKANEEKYRGKWVAITDGRLLASADTLRKLRDLLKEHDSAALALIHHFA